MSNIYYEPEKFGYEIFEHISDDHADYSFDDFVIWKNKESGGLFYATDSGCSCPSPFEDIGVGDLIPVRDLRQLEIAIDEYRGDLRDESNQKCTGVRKQEVLNKVKSYFKEIKNVSRKS